MYDVYKVFLCVTSVLYFRVNSAQLPDLQHQRTKDGESRNFSGSLYNQEGQVKQANISASLPGKVPQAAQGRHIREALNSSQDPLPPFPPPPPPPRLPISRPLPLLPSRAPPPKLSVSVPCNRSLSCQNGCQSPKTVLRQETLSCFCDVDCVFFKDCCADYDTFCHPDDRSIKTPPKQGNLVSQLNRNLWKCYSGDLILHDITGVWMIGSCPSSWPEDDVLYRCRNLSDANTITKDNYRYLPVYTNNGRVYHNHFCAQCNGVSPSEMTHFELSFTCAVSPPATFSPSQRFNFLFSYCDSSKINWKAPVNAPRRYCQKLNVISYSCVNDEYIRNKCINGSAGIVFIPEIKVNYKNIYCALCERHNEIKCGPRSTPPIAGYFPFPQPFSVIFDFKNGERSDTKSYIKVSCPFKHFYDHYLEVCRKGYKTLPSTSSVQEYHALLWFRLKINTVFSDETKIMKLNTSVLTVALGNLFQVNNTHIREPKIAIASKVMFNLQFKIRLSSNGQNKSYRRSPRESSVHRMSFEEILKWNSPFDVSLFGETFTLFKTNTRIISCTNLQNYSRNEYTVVQDTPSAVFIKATGEILKAKEYYIDGKSANDSQAIFVCRQQQLSNCLGVYILINEGEFRVLMNKSIFVNASKQVYDWSEYTWINKSALVCENLSTTYYQSKVVTKDDPVLTTITIICFSLSIIGLVFVLVTYSLFSELRTPPGINLINLSVSILLAQLLWLLGSGQTETPMACTVIAVILHYLFLVSFVWTSIIAFDTWRAFSAKGRRPLADSRSQKMKHCLRHMGVGWIPALAYVSFCVVLDSHNFVTISYKSRRCWIGSKWAILYFLAVPVALSLIFNAVLYVLTLKAIRATATQARAASDHNDRKQSFGIYVRIATLMGFPWVFGFIAPFGCEFFWYPFVVINGLQGVYIALAFAFNKRSRSLYRNRFSCTKWSSAVGTTLDCKSTKRSAVPSITLLHNQYIETKL